MMINPAKILLITFVFAMSLPTFACGTADNWMDAYEGVASSNKWRDSMSKLEKLVMLRSCGGRTVINQKQQTRLLKILTDAMNHKLLLSNMRTRNRDIHRAVNQYRGLIPFEGLIESIYRKYHCLQNVKDNNIKLLDNMKISIYDYFGRFSCPGSENIIMQVNAKGGGNLRNRPKGRVIASLNNGLRIKVVGESEEWFRIINPLGSGNQDTMIGFIHKSIVKDIN